jgi:benzoylformate decarboxylase
MRGIDAFLELLAQHNVHYVFGNPGTTELPLNDALIGDGRFEYIFGLQEIPVMAIADGYALASGRLGVVNLHISCGLGNAMGMLYNAHRQGSPLLVTAGQQDRRLMFQEPILWSDLISVARPWTKYAVEVQRISDLPSAVRRAIQAALTPPTGPVFLSLPLDLQLEWCEHLDLAARPALDTRVRPPQASIRDAARRLAAAERPVVLAGSRVAQRGAVAELVAVAEQIGAVVYSEPTSNHGRLGFPSDHPLYVHDLPMWAPQICQLLSDYDVALVCGMDLLREYIYFDPPAVLPHELQVVHLDEDARELGKNYRVDVGLWGDTGCGLAELNEQLQPLMSESQRSSARQRCQAARDAQLARRGALQREIESQTDHRPLPPAVLMKTIADVLPDQVAVIEAAVTSTGGVLEQLGAIRDPYAYFGQRGWTLGWGPNVAIGVKLAWPDRHVLGLVGDGEAMYGIQGLWSAAHHRIPVTWVLFNNRNYQILKQCAHQLPLPNASQNRFLGLDLVDPEIDFVQLAQALGVKAQRISEPDAIAQALRRAWDDPHPQLIEVPIAS